MNVASWRESASQLAQADLDGLLDAALPFAQQMLDRHGEFYPYAVAINTSGDARTIAGHFGQGEHPSSREVLATLGQGLRLERDGLRAVALVSNTRTATSDAVRVDLEHRDGIAIAAFLPYKQKRRRKGIEYGSLAAAAAAPTVWT